VAVWQRANCGRGQQAYQERIGRAPAERSGWNADFSSFLWLSMYLGFYGMGLGKRFWGGIR
jgi:hypothetical protein